MSTSTKYFRGLPVKDATTSTIVHVNKRDLVGGYQPNYCVVQHALQREFHVKRDEVFVHSTKVFVLASDKTHWIRYIVSSALRIEIIVHDRGGEMKAGEYRLNKPIKSNTLEALRSYYGAGSGKRKPTGKTPRQQVRSSDREHASYTFKEDK
jgi:hypothetical protein